MLRVFSFLLLGVSLTGSLNVAAASDQQSYCGCNISSIWVDVVFLVDSSSYGDVDYSTNFTKAVLSKLTLNAHDAWDGVSFTRAGVISFAGHAQVVNDFTNLTAPEHVTKLSIPVLGGDVSNFESALTAGMDIFNRDPLDNRKFSRKVFVVISSYFNTSGNAMKIIQDFQAHGGYLELITLLKSSSARELTKEEKELAARGRTVTPSQLPLVWEDTLANFCNVNCYCGRGLQPHTIKGNHHYTPNGGCFAAVTSKTIELVAERTCTTFNSKEGSHPGKLASIHDADKQAFLDKLFSTSADYWIGYTCKDNQWTWDDQSTDGYSAWCPGHAPQSAADCSCAYATASQGNGTCWMSYDCFMQAISYVCEVAPCDSTNYCY